MSNCMLNQIDDYYTYMFLVTVKISIEQKIKLNMLKILEK
jgi:hypothetical protein